MCVCVFVFLWLLFTSLSVSNTTNIAFGIFKIVVNVSHTVSVFVNVSMSSVCGREPRRCRKHRGRDGFVVNKTFVLLLVLLLFHFALFERVL